MSYILEALKKSELERKQENIPGLQTVHIFRGTTEKKKAWWKYAFIFVICINVGLAAIWYYTERQEKMLIDSSLVMNTNTISDTGLKGDDLSGRDVVVQAIKSSQPEKIPVNQKAKMIPQKTLMDSAMPVAGKNLADGKAVTGKIEGGTKNASDKLALAKEKSSEPVQASPAMIEQQDGKQLVQKSAENNLEQVAQAKAKISTLTDRNRELSEDLVALRSKELLETQKNNESKDTLNARKNIPAISEKPPIVEHDPRTILHISQLPDSVQSALPDLIYSGHVYSSNPDRRKLVINGRSMNEGEWVTNNLQLDEITIDGAIFSYKEYYYQIELLRNWSVN